MQNWACKSKFTQEIRILPEEEAFELDNRLWDFQPAKSTDRQIPPPAPKPARNSMTLIQSWQSAQTAEVMQSTDLKPASGLNT